MSYPVLHFRLTLQDLEAYRGRLAFFPGYVGHVAHLPAQSDGALLAFVWRASVQGHARTGDV